MPDTSVPVPTINAITFSDTPDGVITKQTVVFFGFWDITPEEARNSFRQLRNFLIENNFYCALISYDSFVVDGYSVRKVPYQFRISTDEGDVSPDDIFAQDDCGLCGEELPFPSVICPTCNVIKYCVNCNKFSDSVTSDSAGSICCEDCGISCDDCERVWNRDIYTHCPDCHPVFVCYSCGDRRQEDNEHIVLTIGGAEQEICSSCAPYMCRECFVISDFLITSEEMRCDNCVAKGHTEEFFESDQEINSIPAIEGRENIRLVGIEIEGANGDHLRRREGGNVLAQSLYDAGLSANDEMAGYHSQGSNKVHVERDSSVDWELVIGPLNMANQHDVQTLRDSVRILRRKIKSGELKFDMRAGMHVHVEAEKVALHHAYNLHKLYLYNEDFLYRIGAANWPFHRSIARNGRETNQKNPDADGKLLFANTFAGNRYYGLSFNNYFTQYLDRCRCGARQFGLFEECICNLGKCTFEFRLFNTTANTIKINAYLAICQALVAKATSMNEITNSEEYPPLDFVKNRVSKFSTAHLRAMKKEWEKRIAWVSSELPLTSDEKKSIHYCVINSEIGDVVTNADVLIQEVGQ